MGFDIIEINLVLLSTAFCDYPGDYSEYPGDFPDYPGDYYDHPGLSKML